MTTILRPDHFTIVTDDLAVTKEFYENMLGFTSGLRPEFKFPGLWLYANEKAILHVIKVDKMPNPRKGALDHMAFRGEDINALLRQLKSAGLEYRLKRTPHPWEQWQVFFKDPNGVDVEIDFDGQEVLDSEHSEDN
ncbi:MAG: dioxygenase [Hellea sp.]|nr:dioxygenase [Hellea sp.]